MANTFKFGNKQWYGKKGSVLAYNDENNNFKPLPFDFTRSSSATRVNKDGLIEVVGSDEPRVDYLNNADGHLLLEPSRTNLVTDSVDLLTSFSNTSNVTETTNATTAPDGTSVANLYQGDGTSTQIRIFKNETYSANTDYVLSVFAKAGTKDSLRMGVLGVDGASSVYFDLTNQITSNNSIGKIEDYGDGWYRCSILTSVTSPDVTGNYNIYISYEYGTVNFPTAAEAGSATMYLWGAQLEQGSYATSYIPTSGSSVTRAVDAALQDAPTSVINSTEGVFYFEGSALFDDGTNRYISLSDGTTSNYIYFRYVSTSNQYLFRTQVGGVTVNTLSAYLSDTTENHKFAFKFKSGDYALWVDGVEISTDTSSTIFSPNTLSKIEYSFPTDGGDGFFGRTKDFRIYNTALTDSELIALTS